MYHTRPIKTYDLLTAITDRVTDQLSDPEPQYDETLSNVSNLQLKKLLGALIEFDEAFLEQRDGC